MISGILLKNCQPFERAKTDLFPFNCWHNERVSFYGFREKSVRSLETKRVGVGPESMRNSKLHSGNTIYDSSPTFFLLLLNEIIEGFMLDRVISRFLENFAFKFLRFIVFMLFWIKVLELIGNTLAILVYFPKKGRP